jgi:hypothetical protein
MFDFPKSRQNRASEVFAEPVFGRVRRHRRIRQESCKSFQTRTCIERGQSEPRGIAAPHKKNFLM